MTNDRGKRHLRNIAVGSRSLARTGCRAGAGARAIAKRAGACPATDRDRSLDRWNRDSRPARCVSLYEHGPCHYSWLRAPGGADRPELDGGGSRKPPAVVSARVHAAVVSRWELAKRGGEQTPRR